MQDAHRNVEVYHKGLKQCDSTEKVPLTLDNDIILISLNTQFGAQGSDVEVWFFSLQSSR